MPRVLVTLDSHVGGKPGKPIFDEEVLPELLNDEAVSLPLLERMEMALRDASRIERHHGRTRRADTAVVDSYLAVSG